MTTKTFERDGVKFTVGPDGDLSWNDVAAIALQLRRQNMHKDEKQQKTKISGEALKAVLLVKKIFPDAKVED
jgi:hypothetical protein